MTSAIAADTTLVGAFHTNATTNGISTAAVATRFPVIERFASAKNGQAN